MGSKQSNEQTSDKMYDPGAPNICYMIKYYGLDLVGQLDVWIDKGGFAPSVSFSIRQLNQLKDWLEKKERESKEERKKLTGRKQRQFVCFEGNWKAFYQWLTEAQIRERRSQAGTDSKSVSQCVKTDRLCPAEKTKAADRTATPGGQQ